jgi:hypothetical protein
MSLVVASTWFSPRTHSSLAGVAKLGVADISAPGRGETDPSTDKVHHRTFGHHADG